MCSSLLHADFTVSFCVAGGYSFQLLYMCRVDVIFLHIHCSQSWCVSGQVSWLPDGAVGRLWLQEEIGQWQTKWVLIMQLRMLRVLFCIDLAKKGMIMYWLGMLRPRTTLVKHLFTATSVQVVVLFLASFVPVLIIISFLSTILC